MPRLTRAAAPGCELDPRTVVFGGAANSYSCSDGNSGWQERTPDSACPCGRRRDRRHADPDHRGPGRRHGRAPRRDRPSHGQQITQRPSYYIPFEELPADADTAIAILQNRLLTVAPGSPEERDIHYLLRLGHLYLGPDQPAGRRETISHTLRVNAWWYTRYVVPRRRVILLDFEGVLSTYWAGRGFAVNPVATAGRWQELNRSYSPEQLAEALLEMGVLRHGHGRDFLLWEYYDVPDQPGVIRPGASGMAQGRIAQLMARAYHRTGEQRFADAARLALTAFNVPVNAGGVLSPVAWPLGVRPMPWYVERAYPGANPWKGAALNGFMVTLLNLRAVAPLLGSRPNPLDSGPPDQRARERAPAPSRRGTWRGRWPCAASAP